MIRENKEGEWEGEKMVRSRETNIRNPSSFHLYFFPLFFFSDDDRENTREKARLTLLLLSS